MSKIPLQQPPNFLKYKGNRREAEEKSLKVWGDRAPEPRLPRLPASLRINGDSFAILSSSFSGAQGLGCLVAWDLLGVGDLQNSIFWERPSAGVPGTTKPRDMADLILLDDLNPKGCCDCLQKYPTSRELSDCSWRLRPLPAKEKAHIEVGQVGGIHSLSFHIKGSQQGDIL